MVFFSSDIIILMDVFVVVDIMTTRTIDIVELLLIDVFVVVDIMISLLIDIIELLLICVFGEVEVMVKFKFIDIIFVIDNLVSMS